MKQPKRLRPCVELLEDRTTPSYGFGYALGVGSSAIDNGNGVAADTAGNASVVGTFNNAPIDLDPGPGSYVLPNAGGVDGFAAQYDPLGNLRWGVHFGSAGSNGAHRVAVDGFGNTFVYGTFTGSVQIGAPGVTPVVLSAAAGTEGLLAKIDPAGNVLWARTLSLANGIATDNAGNVYATGQPQGTRHMYVARYDGASGATAWSQVVSGGTGISHRGYITYANGRDVAVDASGNVYVTGDYMGTIDFNPDPTQTNSLTNAGTTKKITNVMSDAFVLKLNAAGDYAWAGGLGGRGADISDQIAVDGTGKVYMGGSFRDFSGDVDPGPGTLTLPPGSFLVKLDPSRNLLWGRSLVAGTFEVDAGGNIYSTWGFSGTIDADPGPGAFNLTSAGNDDVVVRKLDSAGNFVWATSTGGPGGEGGRAVALDGQGNLYITGSFQATADFDPGAGAYNLTGTPDANGNPTSDVFVSKLVPVSALTASGGATNATIADSQGVGTIADDEPRISISDVSKSEGRRGQTTFFTFTVMLSAAYDQPVTMSFRTANGTATTSDGDYVAKTGTLTFAPGETTKTITIEVQGDSRRETNETFYLDLSGLSGNALFTKSRGIGTILNDD